MDVQDPSAVAQFAGREGAHPSVAAGQEFNHKKPEVSADSPKPTEDVVTLTGGQAVRAEDAPKIRGVNGEEIPPDVTKLRRSYSLDNGDLVMKVVDKGGADKVVKEIPSEELRRIRQAIAKYAEESNNVVTEDQRKTAVADEKKAPESETSSAEPKEAAPKGDAERAVAAGVSEAVAKGVERPEAHDRVTDLVT